VEIGARILNIELSTGKIWVEDVADDLYRKFAGSRGIGAYILYKNLKPGINPLGPENIIIFASGTLTGTMAPCTGRVTVISKSPATGGIFKSSVGGAWGASLKQAGYQFVIVRGQAKHPVFIKIEDKQVTIEDAKDIWGKDVWETNDTLERKYGKDFEVVSIGPAGENKAKIAALMFSYYNAAARGGIGAVMGSKNLKAIIVKGGGFIKPAEPEKYYNLAVEMRKAVLSSPSAKRYYDTGTSGSVGPVNAARAFPSYNFQRGYSEQGDKISGVTLRDSGLLKARRSCYSCVLACHRYAAIDKGQYAGTVAGGPEYETISSLGAGCGVYNMEAILVADQLCSRYGLDTISTGSVIQWAMETYEKGVLLDIYTKSVKPKFGDQEAVFKIIKAIALREEGLGDLLAEGVKIASERIGNGSEKWAIQAKGMEQSRVEVRSAFSYALAFAVNFRGPDHLHAQPIAEFGMREGQIATIEKITGDRKYANPYMLEKRAEIVRWHEDVYAVTDCLGFCTFTTTSEYEVNLENMAPILSAYLGIDFTPEMLKECGRRVVVLERCFNVREGFSRKDDVLPWRAMNEELLDRPGGEAIVTKEKLDYLLDEYYKLHGWDQSTGIPTKVTLDNLGLSDVAEELCSLGKL